MPSLFDTLKLIGIGHQLILTYTFYSDIEARFFVQQVVERTQWPYVRFTGIIFTRSYTDDDLTGGVPPYAREWERRADCVLVDIPPGIIQRAVQRVTARARSELSFEPISQISSLCAVFEMYGISSQAAYFSQKYLTFEEQDFEKQALAWSDQRLSFRTETDLSNISGPELFQDAHADPIP